MRFSLGHARTETLSLAEKRSARRQWECAFLLAGALAAASFAPHAIVLPIVSAVLVIGAILAVAIAWMRAEDRAPGEFTRWDQAGVLIFAGFVAALTGDSAETLQMLELLAETPPARD
jgi:hypothetical protein